MNQTHAPVVTAGICDCGLDDFDCVEAGHEPEGGFAEVHDRCWKLVEDYMRETRNEMPL